MGNWSMKKIVITLLSIMVIAYAIGAVILFTSPQSIFHGEKGRLTVDEEKNSAITGVNNINISTSSAKINVIETDSSEVTAHFYGGITTSSSYQKPQLELDLNGDTLDINVKTRTNFSIGFFMSDLKLDILIPKTYSKSLKLSSSSGSLNVKNLKLERLDCSTSSGGTNLDNISAKEFNHASSSGSLNATGLTTEKTKTSSSSGSRKLLSFTGDLNANSSSGSTKVEYSNFANEIKANASSGSIDITLPENTEFYLEANTSSGGIKCDFPITMKESSKRRLAGSVGNGTHKISVNTSSGSIRINR